MELLSYPLPSYLAQQMSHQQLPAGTSAEQQAQRQRQQRRQQYGVRLRVAGSGWTPAMALDAAELSAAAAGAGAGGAAAQQQQEGDLQAARPVLIRALCREFGVVHEVVMRLEVTAFGTSQARRWGRGQVAHKEGSCSGGMHACAWHIFFCLYANITWRCSQLANLSFS
jgi:hypothetical protein